MGADPTSEKVISAWRLPLLTVGLMLPGYLNDFLYLRTTTPEEWLIVDYGSRILGLAILFSVPEFRRYVREAFPSLRKRFGSWWLACRNVAAYTVVCIGLYYVSIRLVQLPLERRFPDTILFHFPKVPPGPLHTFDLTVGLLLVALSEELVFRVVVARVMDCQRRSNSRPVWRSKSRPVARGGADMQRGPIGPLCMS